MPRLIVHGFTISLGGYGAGPDQTLETPMGTGGQGRYVVAPQWPAMSQPTQAFRAAMQVIRETGHITQQITRGLSLLHAQGSFLSSVGCVRDHRWNWLHQ